MTRGEIWRAQLGIPFGSEAGYTRPVLVIQDNNFNESRIRTVVIIPLTTNFCLRDAPGNILIEKAESGLAEDAIIMIPQIHAIDRRKFIEKISKVSREIMEQVELGVKLVLGFN
jgi:mRNA interferase MazF